MKLDKKIIIILALSSLLLSSIGGAFYLYTQNKKIIKQSNTLKVVYIANKNIAKNKKIAKEDIKSVQISAAYILTPPLLENEIVGKYTKEEIYQNDTFRKEKLSNTIFEEEKKIIPFKHTSYNIAFKLFSNPNYSLKKGEYINIISVYPAENSKLNMDYAVQYIASNIKILGFLEQGEEMPMAFRVIKRNLKDKKGKKLEEVEDVTVYADELLLDIDQNVIIKLIDDYNKGRQLWMVKVKSPEEPVVEEVISKSVEPVEKKKPTQDFIDLIKTQKAHKIIKVEKNSNRTRKALEVQSPYKWYKPKEMIEIIHSATITYADTNKMEQSPNIGIVKNDISKCNERKNLLVGKTYDISLRLEPLKGSKKHDVVGMHTIIPFKKKVGNGWYELCDGSFVYKDEVEEITIEEALQKINEK
jgi:hypothetical protein